MKRAQLIIFLLTALLIFVFSACVSKPAPDSPPTKTAATAPDWFYKTPEEDATYKYFVGSGSSSKKDASEAEETAILDLIDQILMYIGIQITSDTEAKGIGSIDEFKTEISQVVTSSGKAQVSGFEIMEKLPNEKSDALIIYVLSRYNKKDLEKEKAKIEKEMNEKYEAISIPEQRGQELFESGEFYAAAVKFIEAADAASGEKVGNAQIKFERNIKQAMEAIEKINLIRLTDNMEGWAGQPLPKAFELKVVSGGTANSAGVPDVTIKVIYKDFNAAKTKLQTKSAAVKTGKNGVASFTYPTPKFVGAETITMVLDIEDYTKTLDDVPDKWYNTVQALTDLAASKKVNFEFKVISNAKNINTGIALVDVDQDKNPLGSSKTSAALLKYLSAEKYKIKNLSVTEDQLIDVSDSDVIDMLTANFSTKVERAIFGTATILEKSNSDGKIMVKTTASIQVVDLVTGDILLSVVKSVNGMGNNDEQATNNAFSNLGDEVGKYILNNLL